MLVGRDFLAVLAFLRHDLCGLDAMDARLRRRRQHSERPVARQQFVVALIAGCIGAARAVGLNPEMVAGTNHEIFLVFGRGRMLVERDETSRKQGRSISPGAAPAVERLLRLEPELGELLALVLLIMLAGIVVDLPSRSRVLLGGLLGRAQLL